MKKNLIYFLILLVLGVATYSLVIKKPLSTLNEKEGDFAIGDTAAIAKIFIADMKGNKVILERSNGGWMVNQKYPVRSDYMNSFLPTLHNITISYPVSESLQNSVVKKMATDNKKVEIYDRNGKLMKSYFVGGPNLNSDGTYMMMSGAEKPYVTAIPAFNGVVNTRYSTDAEEIRSRVIYDYDLNQISAVSVEYANKPDSSFSIAVLGPDSFEIRNMNGIMIPTAQLNKHSLRYYLEAYQFVNCEGFVNDLPKRDTILQSQPFCKITVTDRQQQPHTTVIYYMPGNSTSEQFDAQGNELKFDVDRYFATINNAQDFVIIQRHHFSRLLKNFSFFFNSKKPGAA